MLKILNEGWRGWVATVLFTGTIGMTNHVFGAGKRPVAAAGKKVIALESIRDVQIEMPDGTQHNFGEDMQASLVTALMETQSYIVADDPSDPARKHLFDLKQTATTRELGSHASDSSGPDYVWTGSVTPSARAEIQVEALNFVTGLFGDRMFYGFDERFRNSFNDGSGASQNEFPLFQPEGGSDPTWFGNSFVQKGIYPFDSRSGLDLGDGFKIDALAAWMRAKYAWYHSELHLKLKLDQILGQPSQVHLIRVSGDGFFVDVVGGYKEYIGGLSLSRTDAMHQALRRALSVAFDAIDRVLVDLPYLAKVDAVMKDGTVLLGTGPNSLIPAGTVYQTLEDPKVMVQVKDSGNDGSEANVISSEGPSEAPSGVPSVAQASASSLKYGQVLIRVLNGSSSSTPHQFATGPVIHSANDSVAAAQKVTSVQNIHIPNFNIPGSDLGGSVPPDSREEASWKSMIEGATLPYRIARYFLYDQPYRAKADWGVSPAGDLSKEPWLGQAGQGKSKDAKPVVRQDSPPVIAVIDSGIDYNHPAVHDLIWLNPSPWKDPSGEPADPDLHGWDFISEDAKPYDDGYHGTQVASVIASVAPWAKIMPLKIFNPWGVTNSAAILGALTYAVDHGAQVIVCAWATEKESHALSEGISYARDHGVAVIAAAGDEGVSLSTNPYYPAVLARDFDNVLTVTAVDSQDRLSSRSGLGALLGFPARAANFDPGVVRLAAPGSDLWVAEPRGGVSRETSTGLAAAMAAGALAKYVDSQSDYQAWIARLLADAHRVTSLESAVKGGLRIY